jgi:hypothetical protein
MTMPNFLLIGAAKSGTTSLYHYLRQHPEVYMSPVKEPLFFAFVGKEGLDAEDAGAQDAPITSLERYQALFVGVVDEKAIGEASTGYFHSSRAAENIRRYIPGAKLVAVLRDPVERAYSTYLMAVRAGIEPLDVAEALQASIRDPHVPITERFARRYLRVGFYYTHLMRYYDRFPPEQIRVYLYEDFQSDPIGLMQGIFEFLGVDSAFVPDTSLRHNISLAPKSKAWHQFLTGSNVVKKALKPFVPARLRENLVRGLKARNLGAPPVMPEELRREYVELYREEINDLASLLQRDLSRWLE